ncbi:MAG TPA: DUF2218 domain-containing protein [Agriterribacter sp.]|nr:DUF2218 domain-containing protein [Agriterribacter sp.]HRQ50040.1 DUF2218 domain-containing protein [Agriterribacter sp.]
MIRSSAEILTKEGSAYIRKLCRHFVHKIPVSYTETDGRAELPDCICLMHADANTLTFTITGATTETVVKGEDIVVRHLEKFAFREQLEISWHRSVLTDN